MREFPRQTLRREVAVAGLGLHSSVPVRMRLIPSDQGITFRCGADVVAASPENVTDTSRCTRLGPISTIEHAMSALAGLGVTDAILELSAPEAPALDGSAAEFVSLLEEAEFEPLRPGRIEGPFARVFMVDSPVKIAIGAGDGLWRYEFETGERWPGMQRAEYRIDTETYKHQIAPARTFAFEEEVGPLRAAGLGQGLDESSALILGKEGYVNAPRFEDEPARHKLLDLIGDLYLSGVPPQFLSVVSEKSGHRANVEAARRLAAAVKITR